MTRLELLHDDPGVTERILPECPFLRLPFAAVFLLPEALELVLLLFGSQLKLSELFLVRRLGLTTGTRSGDGDLEMAGAGNSAGCSLSLASESLSVACKQIYKYT